MQLISMIQLVLFYFLVKFRREYVLKTYLWSQNDNGCEILRENN